MRCDCSNEGRNRALHVIGAATDQQAVLDLRGEGVAIPALARRNHVEVASKAEMRRAFAADRDHILGWSIGRLAHHPAMDQKAERLQRLLENIEDFAARWSDAWAVDQCLRKRDWIERHDSRLAEGPLMPKIDLEFHPADQSDGLPVAVRQEG